MSKINFDTPYLDIDAIMQWCLTSTMSIKEEEIDDVYEVDEDGDLSINNKMIRTSKSLQDIPLKYDFVKSIIDRFLSMNNEDKNSKTFKLLYNTLIIKGFLKD